MKEKEIIKNNSINLSTEITNVIDFEMFKIAKNKKSERFEFINYDEIINKIDFLIDVINTYEYQEEDRKFIKNLKSHINNFVKDLNSNIKSQQEDLFGLITSQHKEFKEKFDKLVNLLNQGIVEQDARMKEQKRAFCENLFENTLCHYDNLENFNIKFEDIFVSQWTNLSTSESSIKKELDARLTNLDEFLASDLSPIKDQDKIIIAFRMNDFNGIKSLNFLQKQYDEEMAKKLLEEEKKRIAEEKRLEEERRIAEELLQNKIEHNEVENRILEKTYITLEIESNDLEKAIKLLADNNIDFRRI